MKKSIFNRGLLLITGAAMLFSCTKNFESINTNPNSPTLDQVEPKFILPVVMRGSKLPQTTFQNNQLLVADIYAQFYANDLGATYNSYKQNDQANSSLWAGVTYPYLMNLNSIIIKHTSNPTQVNIVQIARIWKSWLMLRATDMWGDIPYFKACDGSGEAASYDLQKDIYDDIFKTLADATTKFDITKPGPGTLDIVYSGNYDNWKKFANSLRLRMALRISHVDPVRAKTEAESAIAAGLINSATVRATILCDQSDPIYSPHSIAAVFSMGGFGMSRTFENILTGFGGIDWPAGVVATVRPAKVDPRGPIMFDPATVARGAVAPYVGVWRGTLPGLANAGVPDQTFNNSRIGTYITGNLNRAFNILKYSEVCFLLAEAKVRFPAWNTGSGTAQEWYENGVKDNMTEWGIAGATATTYLASTDANVNGTTPLYTHTTGTYNTVLDKIITQKWLAMFPENGWEAWADHIRLQKPRFIPFENVDAQWFPGAYDKTDIPQNYIRRIAYPVSEQTLNKENLDKALLPLGGSYTGYMRKPMWWDPYAEDGTIKAGATK